MLLQEFLYRRTYIWHSILFVCLFYVVEKGLTHRIQECAALGHIQTKDILITVIKINKILTNWFCIWRRCPRRGKLKFQRQSLLPITIRFLLLAPKLSRWKTLTPLTVSSFPCCLIFGSHWWQNSYQQFLNYFHLFEKVGEISFKRKATSRRLCQLCFTWTVPYTISPSEEIFG